MRRAFVLVGLLAGCFEGEGALGLPCDDDSQCGIDQRCEQGFCGGPPATSSSGGESTMDPSGSSTLGTTTSSSSGSTEGSGSTAMVDSSSSGASTSESSGGTQPACPPPPPEPWSCTAMGPFAGAPTASITMIAGNNPTSVTAGAYSGSTSLDLAVGSHSARTVTILQNFDDDSFGTVAISSMRENLMVDMVATDLECDGVHEFFSVGYEDELESVAFDGDDFVDRPILPISPGGYSLAVGDVVPDENDYPELLVANGNMSDRVVLLGLVDGALVVLDELASVAGPSPWEITVLATADGPRVLVADSDYSDSTMDGPADQLVRVLEVVADDDTWALQPDPMLTPVANDLQNPYAMALGDFVGDTTLELAVAERNVEGIDAFEGTTLTGRVRLFELGAAGFEEVASVETAIGPRAIAAADLDCDGFADLVVSNSGDTTTKAADGVLQVFMGGDTFGTAPAVPVVDDISGGGTRIAVGDFDNDGAPEAAVPDWGGARVIVVDVD